MPGNEGGVAGEHERRHRDTTCPSKMDGGGRHTSRHRGMRMGSICPGKMDGKVAQVCMSMRFIRDLYNTRKTMYPFKLGIAFYMAFSVTCQISPGHK